jgi:hypothetical protein
MIYTLLDNKPTSFSLGITEDCGTQKGKQMKEDIFTILTNGYIPLQDLIKHANKSYYNFDCFEYDEGEDHYQYNAYIDMLWEGDFYHISCGLYSPNEDEGETVPRIIFIYNMNIMEEELRHMPTFIDGYREFPIREREDIINALDEWECFVGEAYMRILRHRLEIMKNFDKVSLSEVFGAHTTRDLKDIHEGYNKWFKTLPTLLANKIEKIIQFDELKEYTTEDEDYYDCETDDDWLGSMLKVAESLSR